MDDIERTKKAVMNEHFSKPLAMEKVIEAIGNYLKKIGLTSNLVTLL